MPVNPLQPSESEAATALAIAWDIVRYAQIKFEGDPKQFVEAQARLVAECAELLLTKPSRSQRQ